MFSSIAVSVPYWARAVLEDRIHRWITLHPEQLANSWGPLLTQSQVRSLHVEWNRMELALDDKIRESLNEAAWHRLAPVCPCFRESGQAHHWTEIDEACNSRTVSVHVRAFAELVYLTRLRRVCSIHGRSVR